MEKRTFSYSKDIFTGLGFLLMFLGILSLILSLIGAHFSFLKWIDSAGPLLGLVIKLVMILAGFVIIFYNKTKDQREL